MNFRTSIFASLSLATIASFVSAASPTLQGSYKITPQDYYGLPPIGLENNPPACGMPYKELNLARITAVQNMNTQSTCGLCLKVVNTADHSKFVYVLAVDLGGMGLDLSIPAFEYIFGQRYDASPASWSTVDDSFCSGVYTPGKTNPNQGVHAGSSNKPNTTTKKPNKTTTSVTKKRTTAIKKTVSKKPTITKKKTTIKKTTIKKKKTTNNKKKSSSKKKTSPKKKTHNKKKTTIKKKSNGKKRIPNGKKNASKKHRKHH